MRDDGWYVVYSFVGCCDFLAHPTSLTPFSFSRENLHELSVTGYHMLDWLYPNDKKRQEQEEKASILLQVCSHIANGIKHFRATAKKHQSIADVRAQGGAFQRNAFQVDAFQVEALVIQLDGQAAGQFGAEVECVTLATQVLQYWENHPGVK